MQTPPLPTCMPGLRISTSHLSVGEKKNDGKSHSVALFMPRLTPWVLDQIALVQQRLQSPVSLQNQRRHAPGLYPVSCLSIRGVFALPRYSYRAISYPWDVGVSCRPKSLYRIRRSHKMFARDVCTRCLHEMFAQDRTRRHLRTEGACVFLPPSS